MKRKVTALLVLAVTLAVLAYVAGASVTHALAQPGGWTWNNASSAHVVAMGSGWKWSPRTGRAPS
jgi:hypothetical protein